MGKRGISLIAVLVLVAAGAAVLRATTSDASDEVLIPGGGQTNTCGRVDPDRGRSHVMRGMFEVTETIDNPWVHLDVVDQTGDLRLTGYQLLAYRVDGTGRMWNRDAALESPERIERSEDADWSFGVDLEVTGTDGHLRFDEITLNWDGGSMVLFDSDPYAEDFNGVIAGDGSCSHELPRCEDLPGTVVTTANGLRGCGSVPAAFWNQCGDVPRWHFWDETGGNGGGPVYWGPVGGRWTLLDHDIANYVLVPHYAHRYCDQDEEILCFRPDGESEREADLPKYQWTSNPECWEGTTEISLRDHLPTAALEEFDAFVARWG